MAVAFVGEPEAEMAAGIFRRGGVMDERDGVAALGLLC